MADEINRIEYTNDVKPEEFTPNRENPRYDETYQAKETQEYEEFGTDSQPEARKREDRKKQRSSAQAQAHLVSAAVVVAAVAVLALVPSSIFAPLFEPFGAFGDALGGGSDDPAERVTAEFVTLDVTEDMVTYAVQVSGGSDGSTYAVSVENKFTHRTQTFSGDSFSSTETGLKPGMDYTVSVELDGAVLASRTVTTATEPETYFKVLHAECTCIDDGFFHLTVAIDDGDGTWTGFRAELSDLFGNTSVVDIPAEGGEVLIPVTSAGLEGDMAELTITCVEDGGEKVLYHNDEIMI